MTSWPLQRTAFVRATLRFWTAAGLVGLLLGGSLRVFADGSCPAWLGGSGVRGATTRPYTPGRLALANLSAQIDGGRAALVRHPSMLDLRRGLVGHLLERARFTGAASDLDEALGLVDAIASDTPRAEQLLLEASTLAALHRFPEALERLERAEARGAGAAEVTRQRDTIQLAVGLTPTALAPAIERRARAARQRPSMGSLVDYAAALAAAGRLDEADAILARAGLATRDVSPLPVAWIAFYRGTLAAEQRGDAEAGERHYREALRLVPDFVRASVHLAELEAARGDEAAARARLRSVLTSEDPEPASRLAELSTGATRAGLVRQARAGYTALLARHRAAYLDHALEFALAHEPEAAATSTLASELLAARPIARSYQLALRASATRGDRAATCSLGAAARPLAATHPVLAADLATLGCP